MCELLCKIICTIEGPQTKHISNFNEPKMVLLYSKLIMQKANYKIGFLFHNIRHCPLEFAERLIYYSYN